MSNVEELELAGVLNPASLTPAQKTTVNDLSAEEVEKLKNVRKKVGDFGEEAHPGGRPWLL